MRKEINCQRARLDVYERQAAATLCADAGFKEVLPDFVPGGRPRDFRCLPRWKIAEAQLVVVDPTTDRLARRTPVDGVREQPWPRQRRNPGLTGAMDAFSTIWKNGGRGAGTVDVGFAQQCRDQPKAARPGTRSRVRATPSRKTSMKRSEQEDELWYRTASIPARTWGCPRGWTGSLRRRGDRGLFGEPVTSIDRVNRYHRFERPVRAEDDRPRRAPGHGGGDRRS